MIAIGLTGVIGSGKSTVAKMLVARGAAYIDADLVGHRSYEEGTFLHQRLIDEFGRGILAENGEIDRRRLGERVFGDPQALERLNAIVWPAMAETIEEDLRGFRLAKVEMAVLEAAVLFEAGWQRLVDEVWAVVASPEVARQRLAAKGVAAEQAEARIRSQINNEARVQNVHVVIENNGNLAELEARVQSLWEALHRRIRTGRG